MLLETVKTQGFFATWGLLYVSGFIFITLCSSATFYFLYWTPSFDMWQRKSCPRYPAPEKVREEIFQMTKGLLFSTLPPTLCLFLSFKGYSQGYFGFPHSWQRELAAQAAYWLILDFVEWFYHYGTHTSPSLWQFHKFHHTFPNPSPFAVIADEVLDQLVRASPTLWVPFFIPLNVELMFLQMAVIHYVYGTYLHCGFEFNYPDAHHPYVNTSYHHYCHHAVSIANRPYHCGFFVSFFDRMAGSVYTGQCFCCKCCVARGERTKDNWEAVKKPDYRTMLKPSFWWQGIRLEGQKIKNGSWVRVS